MSGYVLDDLALVAGLSNLAGEQPRRGMSWLIHAAVSEGRALDVPALCLAEAATARRSIAAHVADLVASAPPGTVAVGALVRDADLDALLGSNPALDWGPTHAALHALATGHPIVTLRPDRYKEVAVDVVPL